LTALSGSVVLSCSPLGLAAGSSKAGAAVVSTCSSTALSLLPGFTEAAAGNVGTPIVITNNGPSACSIAGYPIIVGHTEVPSSHPVTFVHRPRSQIYVAVPVKTVVVAPKGTASFGITYVDGDDQSLGQGRDCLMNSITVRIPQIVPARKIVVLFKKGSDGFGGPINSCFTAFEFGLTPIVKGSTPPEN
jgi:hypothetical protein